MEEPGRSELDIIKQLHGRKRLEHIWGYYRIHIFAVLIIVYCLGYGVYRYAAHKDTILYIGFVNVAAGETAVQKLTTGFIHNLGLDSRKNQVTAYQGLVLADESDAANYQYMYASQLKILASIDVQQLDAVIMDEKAREIFMRNAYLSDFSELVPGASGRGEVLSVDISSSPFIREAGFDGPVYLSVIENSPRRDIAAKYIAYLLGG